MFGILLSAFNTVLGWLLKQVVVKFVMLTAIYVAVATLVNNLAEFVGGSGHCCSIAITPSALSDALSLLPTSIWFWLDLFSFTQGACLVFSAMAYRFLIRRMPIIG